MYFLLTFILSMLIWVIFSGLLDAFHLTLGVVSSILVSVFSSRILFPNHTSSMGSLAAQSLRFIPYFIWLMKEIIVSNFHVLYLALFPGAMKHVQPSIVKFKLGLKSESARYLLANSITLTPGTVSVQIKGDELWVHSISQKTTESLEGDMEKRVARVFGESLTNS